MTQSQRQVWIRKIKAHLDTRLKEACREGVKAYWPITENYDPKATDEAKLIYVKFKKALRKTMKAVKL